MTRSHSIQAEPRKVRLYWSLPLRTDPEHLLLGSEEPPPHQAANHRPALRSPAHLNSFLPVSRPDTTPPRYPQRPGREEGRGWHLGAGVGGRGRCQVPQEAGAPRTTGGESCLPERPSPLSPPGGKPIRPPLHSLRAGS